MKLNLRYRAIMLMNLQQEFNTSNINDWSAEIKKNFGGLEILIDKPKGFQGQLEIREIASLNLAMVISTAAHIFHPGSIGSYSAEEQYLVKTQFLGHSRVKFNNNVINLYPGDSIICDNARNYDLEFDETTEILSIPIPNRFLTRFHANPNELTFKKPSANLASAKLVFHYIHSLWQSRNLEIESEYTSQLLDMYFELLVMYFRSAENKDQTITTAQSGHLKRCKDYIDRNIKNENLSVDEIAREMSISRRYLFQIFSKVNLSVSGYIFSRRLDLSAQMLRSHRFKKLSISEIAFDCGFKSAAHFSRSFKTRFNQSPSEYRLRD